MAPDDPPPRHVFEHLLKHSENPDNCCPYCRDVLTPEAAKYYWEEVEWYDYWVICASCFEEQGLETWQEAMGLDSKD